jgi:Periplasmic protease
MIFRMSRAVKAAAIGAFVLFVGFGGGGSPVAAQTSGAPAVSARIEDPSGRVEVPFTLDGGHIFVDGTLNGKPARFVLDSGAGANIFTPDAAKRFGLKSLAAAQARGATTVDAFQTRIDRLSVGGAVLENEQGYVVPLPPQLACDGLLGFGLLRHFAVTIDYEKKRLILVRGKPALDAGTTAADLGFDNNIPTVEAEVDGEKGRFRLDTGAGDALTLFKPFVDQKKLRDRYSPRVETVTGRGVGGLLKGDLVRVGSFKIGGAEIKGVITELSRQESGAFHDDHEVGNIGSGILHRFTVTFDYPNKRLYLRPNAHFSAPFSQSRAGIAVDMREDGTYYVAHVVPGGPAAEAGIQTGDLVLAIDGTPIKQMTSSAIRAVFRQTGDRSVRVEVQDASGAAPARTVTVKLRDLL